MDKDGAILGAERPQMIKEMEVPVYLSLSDYLFCTRTWTACTLAAPLPNHPFHRTVPLDSGSEARYVLYVAKVAV